MRLAANARKSELVGESFKIGAVAKLAGIGIEALRFYERSGLLDQPVRTESGYRAYGPQVFDRLKFIRQAQILGFSLDEIGQLIREKRAGKSPCSHVRDVVRRRLEELDERMKEMKRYRRELAAALAEWDERGDADGHICGLIESTHDVHPLGSESRLTKKRG